MYHHFVELKVHYVQSAENPTLLEFLHLNKHLFYNHTFSSFEELSNDWKKKFSRYCPIGSTVVETRYWNRLFELNKVDDDQVLFCVLSAFTDIFSFFQPTA